MSYTYNKIKKRRDLVNFNVFIFGKNKFSKDFSELEKDIKYKELRIHPKLVKLPLKDLLN